MNAPFCCRGSCRAELLKSPEAFSRNMSQGAPKNPPFIYEEKCNVPNSPRDQSLAKKTEKEKKKKTKKKRRRRSPRTPCLPRLEKCFLSNAEWEHGQGEQSDDAHSARPTCSGDSLGDLMQDNLRFFVLLRSAKKVSLPLPCYPPLFSCYVMLSAGVSCYCKLYFMNVCNPGRKPSRFATPWQSREPEQYSHWVHFCSRISKQWWGQWPWRGPKIISLVNFYPCAKTHHLWTRHSNSIILNIMMWKVGRESLKVD